jgi:thiol-disulfide isomerase/thioredoxin
VVNFSIMPNMSSQFQTSQTLNSSVNHRRRAMLWGVGGLAGVLGATAAWQRAATQTPALQEPFAGFWDLQWQAPDGTPVALNAFRGKALLLNFWATWCPPCVEELPLINAFYQENKSKGWNVLGLAVDKPSAVVSFLNKMPLAFPVAIADLAGVGLGRQLGNLTGSLPFSVVLDRTGNAIQRKMGRLHAQDLAAWARLK